MLGRKFDELRRLLLLPVCQPRIHLVLVEEEHEVHGYTPPGPPDVVQSSQAPQGTRVEGFWLGEPMVGRAVQKIELARLQRRHQPVFICPLAPDGAQSRFCFRVVCLLRAQRLNADDQVEHIVCGSTSAGSC